MSLGAHTAVCHSDIRPCPESPPLCGLRERSRGSRLLRCIENLHGLTQKVLQDFKARKVPTSLLQRQLRESPQQPKRRSHLILAQGKGHSLVAGYGRDNEALPKRGRSWTAFRATSLLETSVRYLVTRAMTASLKSFLGKLRQRFKSYALK